MAPCSERRIPTYLIQPLDSQLTAHLIRTPHHPNLPLIPPPDNHHPIASHDGPVLRPLRLREFRSSQQPRVGRPICVPLLPDIPPWCQWPQVPIFPPSNTRVLEGLDDRSAAEDCVLAIQDSLFGVVFGFADFGPP